MRGLDDARPFFRLGRDVVAKVFRPVAGDRELLSEEFAWENAVQLNLEAFARAVRGTSPYPFTDAQKIGNAAVLEAVAQSVASGAPVRIQS